MPGYIADPLETSQLSKLQRNLKYLLDTGNFASAQ